MERAAKAVGQRLQIRLEQVRSHTVAAAPIAQQHDLLGLRIQQLTMVLPPQLQAIAGKGTGVVAGAQVEITAIQPHIIKAVRDDYPLGITRKVVVVDALLYLTIQPAIAVEGADQFAFFAIHGQHRQSCGQSLLPLLANILELLVALGRVAQRQRLKQRAAMKVMFLQQLRDDASGDRNAVVVEAVGNCLTVEIGPEDLLVFGTAGGMIVEDLAKGIMDMGDRF